ncbi:MAG: GTP-binding protein [Candidatus Lokiarchaeota archaeon]|nr:GTP-binding protein [Candidatus Harpocratesius repetitus]
MIKLKLIVAGAKDVGKTSLIRRYIHGTFQSETISTIGVDFMIKRLELDEKSIQLSIWDFGGEQKFRSLFPGYISGSSGALILFDISNQESFFDLNNWMELINNSSGKMIKLLVISKIDLKDSASISDKDIEQFVHLNEIDGVLRCSAKTGENVDQVFETITRMIVNNTLDECPHCHEIIAKDLHFCTYCGKEIN